MQTSTTGILRWVLHGDFNHPNPVPCSAGLDGPYKPQGGNQLKPLPPLQLGDQVRVMDGEGNSCLGVVVQLLPGKKVCDVEVDYKTWATDELIEPKAG